jgi:hypothetical protein
MELGRSLKGSGRERRATVLADPAQLELLNVSALRSQAAAAGLAFHQAATADRCLRGLEQALILRELARRTGEAETLAKSASAGERAAREAGRDPRRLAAARMEQALSALLSAELFGGEEGLESASGWLDQAEQALGCAPGRLNGPGMIRARIEVRRALVSGDRDAAMATAALFDESLAALDARVRATGHGELEAAAARCARAELLVGLGERAGQPGLLDRAAEDLRQLTESLDPAYLPLSWTRAETLRGRALRALGVITGEMRVLADSATILAGAADQIPADHSPLDRAQSGHALGLSLQALAEVAGQAKLYPAALTAFDRSVEELGPAGRGLVVRAALMLDRALCAVRAADQRGGKAALNEVETGLKTDLGARNPDADPVAWAVAQVALARLYEIRAGRNGESADDDRAAVALSAALDVFSEARLHVQAEAVKDALRRLKARA